MKMNKIILLIILSQNLSLILSSNVTLIKNEFQSTPNSAHFKLKCDFHLEPNRQTVERVDITKDNRVFYSVEYKHGNDIHSGHPEVPPHIKPGYIKLLIKNLMDN